MLGDTRWKLGCALLVLVCATAVNAQFVRDLTGFDFHLRGVIWPNLNDVEKFLAEVEGSASRKLGGGWFLRFSAKYAYNSHPSAGKEKGDVTYAASLVLKF